MRSPADPDTTVIGNDQLVAVVLGAAITAGYPDFFIPGTVADPDNTPGLVLGGRRRIHKVQPSPGLGAGATDQGGIDTRATRGALITQFQLAHSH